MILSALYMLWMFQRVMFGPLTHVENEKLSDLSMRERLVFAPILILIFWIGFTPQPILKRVQPTLDRTIELAEHRAAREGVQIGQGSTSAAPAVGMTAASASATVEATCVGRANGARR